MPRLAFAGSSDFAVPTLRALAAGPWELTAVLTQPDRPAGRRRRLTPTPVRSAAEALGIAVSTPESFRNPAARDFLSQLAPDALVVVDYGLILPPEVLSIPVAGCINGHASLLPRWRGAAPVSRAILAGDEETGVSVMKMEAGLDTGPVYLVRRTAIGPRETAGELRLRLATLCAEALVEALPAVLDGTAVSEPQDDSRATYAAKLTPEEGRIDWSGEADAIARRIRAFSPRPGAWTPWGALRLKLHRAESLAERPAEVAPGNVWRTGPEGIDVAAGAGSVRVLELQPPGSRLMGARAFLNSRPLAGETLGRE
ncbi:MAG: methionyl-tRNA formyltransferase [Gammaproteobacteria bacterium]